MTPDYNFSIHFVVSMPFASFLEGMFVAIREEFQVCILRFEHMYRSLHMDITLFSLEHSCEEKLLS